MTYQRVDLQRCAPAVECTPVTPDHDLALFRLAEALAKPVVRGLLDPGQAEAALLVYSIRAARAGTTPYDPVDLWDYAKYVLHLHADLTDARRQTAIGAIRRSLEPLIGIRAPANRIRAAAHDANGLADFPLTEPEVEEVTGVQVWRAMNPSEAEADHG